MTRVFQTRTGKNVIFNILAGDIASIPADAMITAINSSGMWFGGIDGVIQKHAGNQFHSQAMRRGKLTHLDTVVARKAQPHSAKFENVVFVVDDLATPLEDIVFAGLLAAAQAGFTSVSLPAIRTGVMLGVVEKTAQDAVNALMRGIVSFFDDDPDTTINDVRFVIYGGGEIMSLLNTSAQKMLA